MRHRRPAEETNVSEVIAFVVQKADKTRDATMLLVMVVGDAELIPAVGTSSRANVQSWLAPVFGQEQGVHSPELAWRLGSSQPEVGLWWTSNRPGAKVSGVRAHIRRPASPCSGTLMAEFIYHSGASMSTCLNMY